MLILFKQSGLFASSHAVALVLGHTPVVSRTPTVWTRTVISTTETAGKHVTLFDCESRVLWWVGGQTINQTMI
jgi:hypothetical protein